MLITKWCEVCHGSGHVVDYSLSGLKFDPRIVCPKCGGTGVGAEKDPPEINLMAVLELAVHTMAGSAYEGFGKLDKYAAAADNSMPAWERMSSADKEFIHGDDVAPFETAEDVFDHYYKMALRVISAMKGEPC